MPVRPFSRAETWLLPPSLEELVPAGHSVRFVAEIVDGLSRAEWQAMGIDPDGAVEGGPAYAPQVLLGVWLYGFMTAIRSCRRLEYACQEQIPMMWLTGRQRPDHNTLWRFYQAHRKAMRLLFRKTVRIAVESGLVDLALQAVDGTKVQANAAKERTYDAAALQRMLHRTDQAIADLEAQNTTSDSLTPASLPAELATQEALRERVQEALERVRRGETRQVNLTDPEAVLVKSRQGYVAGYNAQAMVSPVEPTQAGRTGLFITAAEVMPQADDHSHLVPMLEQAEEQTGQRAQTTLADGGYHSGATLTRLDERGQAVMMPDAQQRQAGKDPYHKLAFRYDPDTDTYRCPKGETLRFGGIKRHGKAEPSRVYRAIPAVCRRCPAFGTCTTNRRNGRTLEVRSHEQRLQEHRDWMATAQAKELYRFRKMLVEPAFGLLKERLGLRRFHLRGLANVRAEWHLLATAFNLLTLWRIWKQRHMSLVARLAA
jgi:transposase